MDLELISVLIIIFYEIAFISDNFVFFLFFADIEVSEDAGASSLPESTNDIASLCSSASSLASTNQMSPTYLRPLPEEEDADDRMYYGILMKNIKLWKYSAESINSSESDSSFDS
jgi:hypothetical protein